MYILGVKLCNLLTIKVKSVALKQFQVLVDSCLPCIKSVIAITIKNALN